jgi:Tfp pilus tip-associated adhesin PilY1
MKKCIYCLTTIAVFLMIGSFSYAQVSMDNFCSIPPFVSAAAPPNVMVMVSVETPMQGALHPDVTCGYTAGVYGCTTPACMTTDAGGRYISNCYDNTKNYSGYFNPAKCYSYASSTFTVSGNASSHQCSGNWSGNFLNWATMTALDGFRGALTGGNRSTDTNSSTILLAARETLNTDSANRRLGHSWFPLKRLSTNTNLYTPYAAGTTIYIGRHANGFSVCSSSDCRVNANGGSFTKGNPQTGTTTNVTAAFTLNITACASGNLEPNCVYYPSSGYYKPEGLIQQYETKMRFGLISYSSDNSAQRNGGIIRSNVKWVSRTIPYGMLYHTDATTAAPVECTTATGCTNPVAEVQDTNGTFIADPDAFGGSYTNSGVINYINKFGYANGYKSYDPVGEMYYQAVRYFMNKGPSNSTGAYYCGDGTITYNDDGFPNLCNQAAMTKHQWRDPYLYPCQQGVILAINDANPWCDKKIPGTAFTAAGAPADTNCTNDHGSPDADMGSFNVTDWTNKVGKYEFGSSFSLKVGCNLDGVCDWSAAPAKTVTNLGRVSGSFPYVSKNNSYYIAGLAYYAHTMDLRADLEGSQTLTTYMMDTQETNPQMLVGNTSMLYLAAKYGGFNDKNGVNADGDLVPDLTPEWDKDAQGFPDNYLLAAENPSDMINGFGKFFLDIISRSSSGTASSVLASSEGSGANISQAVFYPKRLFTNSDAVWTGELKNLWYYVDPFFQNSSIRDNHQQDTATTKYLNLRNDYEIQYFVDSADGHTKVRLLEDSNGDGAGDTSQGTVPLEDIVPIWEAGRLLWERSDISDPRTIKTSDSSNSFVDFATTNASTLQSSLQAGSLTDAQNIINYVRGTDISTYRNRTVTTTTTTGSVATNVWKLGDIISSTPRVQSTVPLNTYHLLAPAGYQDSTYTAFIQDTAYQQRGMIYAGANDGMLHAFNLGVFSQVPPSSTATVAQLAGSDMGKEVWAYLPRNILPYLTYLKDPNYCHIYYVNNPATLFDASIYSDASHWASKDQVRTATKTKDSWRTILIGAMGLGGACKDKTVPDNSLCACTSGSSCTDAVRTPVNGLGYSSYFALDVTTPGSPELLWELSSPCLGYATSGPAIVKVANSTTTNGKWYAIFASGPTGKVDSTWKQFTGVSDQNLQIFVVDLLKGTIVYQYDTGIAKAFAGSLRNATFDPERSDAQATTGRYSDDVVYVPYTNWDTTVATAPKWNGGVLRITVDAAHADDPSQWHYSTVIQDVGPITTGIAKLQDRRKGNFWLYFGTGRFFYKRGADIDDAVDQRALYGIKEPCYQSNNTIGTTCVSSVPVTSLTDVSTTPVTSVSSGWKINLDLSGNDTIPTATGTVTVPVKAERLVASPVASSNGVVFFTTLKPSADFCSQGGNSYLWASWYETGGPPPNSALLGQAIIQVSSGSISLVNLRGAGWAARGGAGSGSASSSPVSSFVNRGIAGDGFSVQSAPTPLRRILHIKEK